jgi:hypothetical protein
MFLAGETMLKTPECIVALPMLPGFKAPVPMLAVPMKPVPPFALPMAGLPMEVVVPMVPPVIFLELEELEVPIIWADAATGRASATIKARHTAILLFLDIPMFSYFFEDEGIPQVLISRPKLDPGQMVRAAEDRP